MKWGGGGGRTFKTNAFLQTLPTGTHTEKQIFAYWQTCQTLLIRQCWPSFLVYYCFFEKKIEQAYEVALLSVCPSLTNRNSKVRTDGRCWPTA
jgi:hypothetical protein